ncbi:MAG TPA: hypothetical protein VGF25_15005 [Thermoleophilaceae bacterium]
MSALAAGPLTARLDGVDLVEVRVGRTEVVRRVGVRVRDPDWETVRPAVHDAAVRERPDGFACGLRARHRSGPLDFSWHGSVAGARDGSLVYEMSGRALSAFGYGRIGICVLHPPSVAGRSYRAHTRDGPTAGRLPELVAPQPITAGVASPLVPAFTRLEIDLEPDLTVLFELDGDLFELEDQRNWADGSFKTYSTPVGLPTPFHAEPGLTIRQRVRARVSGSACAQPRRPTGPDRLRLRIGRPLATKLPPVGLCLDADGHRPDAAAAGLLRALAPAHVRTDIKADRADAQEALAGAAETAEALGSRLELALVLDGDEADATSALRRLGDLVADLPLERLIVLHRREWVTGPRWAALVRAELAPAAPVLVGTNFHFAELNRDRPDSGTGDGLVYSLTPQAHDDDEATLVHSLEAQRATVETARTFAAGRPVHVSPVTLKPRLNPYATAPAPGAPNYDERQPSPFAAAWTLGSVKHLAEGGAASITYFESTGPSGIVLRTADDNPAQPVPAYYVLRDVCAWRDRELVGCTSSEPLAAEGLLVRIGRSLSGSVANLTSRRQSILLGPCDADSATVRMLDDQTAPGDAIAGGLRPLRGGELELDLPPYAVARIEFRDDDQGG